MRLGSTSDSAVISPHTPFAAMEPWIESCGWCLIMSVHPGFGGQSFIPEVLSKVAMARKWVDSHGLTTDVQIDGGITSKCAAARRSRSERAGGGVGGIRSGRPGCCDRCDTKRNIGVNDD